MLIAVAVAEERKAAKPVAIPVPPSINVDDVMHVNVDALEY